MSNQLSLVNNIDEMMKLANAIAKSGLFGMSKPEEALALMAISHAEGYSPALAAKEYHIIKGKPTLKSDAMLARFQSSGGKVRWDCYEDTKVCGTFSHPQGGEITVDWDIERAKRAGLLSNPTWQKYPRNMLRARVISEAIRTIYPGVGAVGLYTPEEMEDMEPHAPQRLPSVQRLTNPETNKSELYKLLKEMKEEYEGVDNDDLIVIGKHLMTLPTISDSDLPLMVRQELDEKFKRKAINVES